MGSRLGPPPGSQKACRGITSESICPTALGLSSAVREIGMAERAQTQTISASVRLAAWISKGLLSLPALDRRSGCQMAGLSATSMPGAASKSRKRAPSLVTLLALASALKMAPILRAASRSTPRDREPRPISWCHPRKAIGSGQKRKMVIVGPDGDNDR